MRDHRSLFFAAEDWLAGSYSATKYFERTVTPGSGVSVDYTTATLQYTIGTNPTFTHEIRTSLDGFTSAIASHITNPAQETYSDPLAALGIQTGAVTFRLYGQVSSVFGTSGLYAGNMGIFADDGAVITPEPASLGLVAGTLSLGLGLRRIRRA